MKERILLLLLPFWPPLIPPMGLACLKSFLQQHRYEVRTVDANVEGQFRELYDIYFNILKESIPPEQQGNIYNVGFDVLQNHMTAHLNRNEGAKHSDKEQREYLELVKIIIRSNFFYSVDDELIQRLDNLLAEFYLRLNRYLIRLLESEKPDVLGISVYKGTFAASLFAFKRTQERYPHIMTVMGGGIFADQMPVGSPNFRYFLEQTPYIDKIIVGEGELLFLKLLQGELPKSQRVYTLKDMSAELLDLSLAPLPDFSDFDLTHYPQLASYTSRSCPFQCNFCAETVNWGKYRKKSAVQVAEELRELYNTYGSQLYLMSDSLLNPIITDLANELLNSDITIYWDGYIRADKHACKAENAFLWRRGGCYRARLGVESGSAKVLELMDKRITPEMIRDAVFNLALAGIKTSTYWLMGYPGETETDFQQTLDLVEKLKDNIYEAECNPFRFHPTAQVRSPQWAEEKRTVLLYPQDAREWLMLQTWIMEEPQIPREVIYQRVNRFAAHCTRLGIPNPYSWPEIYAADERWKKLHPNAPPPLVTFRDANVYIDECKKVERVLMAQNIPLDNGDFDF